MTDMLFSIVLPSLVIIVSPFPLRIILSMPLGPREVLIASATAGLMLAPARSAAEGRSSYLSRRRCWKTGQPSASPCPISGVSNGLGSFA
jgi:hypothetical protein